MANRKRGKNDKKSLKPRTRWENKEYPDLGAFSLTGLTLEEFYVCGLNISREIFNQNGQKPGFASFIGISL